MKQYHIHLFVTLRFPYQCVSHNFLGANPVHYYCFQQALVLLMVSQFSYDKIISIQKPLKTLKGLPNALKFSQLIHISHESLLTLARTSGDPQVDREFLIVVIVVDIVVATA